MSLSKFQNENTNITQNVFSLNEKPTSPITMRGCESILSKLENKVSNYNHKTFLSNNYSANKKNTTNFANINSNNSSAVYSPFVIKKTASKENSESNNSFFRNNNFELFQQRNHISNLNNSNNNNNNNNLTSIIFNNASDDEFDGEDQESAIDKILGGNHFSLFEIASSEHKKPALANFINNNSHFNNCNNISVNSFEAQATKSFFSPEISLNKGNFANHQTSQQTKFYTPSPNNYVKDRRLSDRFIPLNKGVNLIEKFELTKKTQINSESKKANLSNLDTSLNNLSLGNDSNRININNGNANDISNNQVNNSTNNLSNNNINNNSNNGSNANLNETFFANSNNGNLQNQFYSSLLQSNIFTFTANSENANPSSRGGPIINKNLLNQTNQNNSNLLNSNANAANNNENDNNRSIGNSRNGQAPHLNANRLNNNNLINNNNINESENSNLNFAKENQFANKVKSKLFEFKSEKLIKNKSVFVCENNLFNSLNPNKNLNFLNFSGDGKFGSGNENCNPNRKIPNKPYRVLDAPGLSDDFYLNLLDWSSQNTIAIGLENQVFLWCCKKTKAYKLFSYEESPGDSRSKMVTSLIWNPDGTELAVGNNYGQTEIWDGKNLI